MCRTLQWSTIAVDGYHDYNIIDKVVIERSIYDHNRLEIVRPITMLFSTRLIMIESKRCWGL